MKNKKPTKQNAVIALIAILFLTMIVFAIFISKKYSHNKHINNISINNYKLPNSNNLGFNNNTGGKFTSYFPNCGLINNNCLDTSCNEYFLCSDKKYSLCEIYDCGDEFGVGTEDKNGNIDIKRKIKVNSEKISAMKKKCSGTLEKIETNCVENKLEIKTKVTTNGDCKVEGFLAAYGNLEDPKEYIFEQAEFIDLKDGFYLVKTNSCDEISKIIAIGEGGIGIK